jgi:hypothetical protein
MKMGVDFNVVVLFKTNQTSLGLNYVLPLLEAINFLLKVHKVLSLEGINLFVSYSITKCTMTQNISNWIP